MLNIFGGYNLLDKERICSNCHAEEHDRLFREGYSQFDSDI